MAKIHPSYLGPERHKLARLVVDKHVQQRETLKQVVSEQAPRPACVLDFWSDRRGRHYLGVAITFIDRDWVLRVVNIGFRSFEERHTGEKIKVCFSYSH